MTSPAARQLDADDEAQLLGAIDSSVWMSITGIFNSHLMLALAVEKFGTPAQKAEWLPKLASGEIRGGLALTELMRARICRASE